VGDPSGQVTLRPATPADAELYYATQYEALGGYFKGVWDEAVHRARTKQELADNPVQIVEQGGVPIGYVVVSQHDDHWYLDEISLIASARNRGIGSQLVRDVMAAARAAAAPLRLSVLDTNPAQHLYARLGFRVTRIEPPRIKMEWP
jgi:ribosomal protein S18 acetylase RimI-like enzyme